MSAVVRIEGARSQDLRLILISMMRYGKPRLGVYTSGWHCSIEMNTNTTGTSFEVKSGFDLPDPLVAVHQCWDRMQAALAALGATR